MIFLKKGDKKKISEKQEKKRKKLHTFQYVVLNTQSKRDNICNNFVQTEKCKVDKIELLK